MNRMYSLLTVKAVEDEQRIIRGIATTPNPDRVGDIVEPLGVRFKNPMPLLHHHDHDKPVGSVSFDKPTPDGITFEARLPQIAEPGPLRDRVETAWGEVKAGLVRAVSIGFRALEYAFLDSGGIRFTQTEVLELSLVTVPANADAKISLIKSIDAPVLAATGKEPRASDRPVRPGASGTSTKPVNLKPENVTAMKTVAEQIAALEATRQAKAARMAEVMQTSIDEGRSTDAAEQEEFDTLEQEVQAIDGDLKRLRALEKAQAASARPVVQNQIRTAEDGAAARSGVVVTASPKLPPGIGFARLARVKALAKLDGESPRTLAKELYGENSVIYGIVSKAAVPAGTTSNATWAGALVGEETSVFADFVEFLRPQTILGRFGANGVPALRQVPFRVALIGQTSGGQGYWVGEGKAKPLTRFDFERKTLEPLKVANIAVVSEETLRDSSPSAEMIVRDQLAAALRERLDRDFIDPAKAAAANVSPASITHGLTPIASSGNDADAVRADIRALFGAFIAANNTPTSGVWVMPATTALALSLMQNPLGQAEFAGISMNGGTLFGLPVIASEFVPSPGTGAYVALVNAADVYLADEGGVAIDMSREASLEMADTPAGDAGVPTGAQLVSLWQTDSVGFRAERTVNWARRRASGVALLSGVKWGAPPATP
ncbi:phage major capsid protein [Methylobacterium nodulans]|uniref:Peptidase U35 phage prohead HK97 n=1 Tax=Methylobacterium nodulans (strain LMG 21967 / CNCM I-2342 / ORS 2060) TaxID=460265 RepID=B8IA95_METNO|nr:phage major capsid protein [Methylobacterium nodulans]ACL57576.1 peptidase U35 phage prohead HK97 [Methylobacterium nodulans ORS 2060]ACL59158.1 peptidase U35 phage prohead HK97 [Methylobacterium nodulans ORS 2060]